MSSDTDHSADGRVHEQVTESPGHTDPAFRRAGIAVWSAFAGWIVVSFAMFQAFVRREVDWSYPPYHDQLQYLYDAYTGYDAWQSSDDVNALISEVTTGRLSQRPQGVLLVPVEAISLFRLFGPSRLAALSVNFLHFAALQLSVVMLLRWLSGRWVFAVLGWGCLLACRFPFSLAGGWYDFRLDFPSFCLFGILCCLLIRSGPLQSLGWTALSALVAAFLIASRFITAAYIGGITGLAAVVLVISWLRGRRRGGAQRVGRQILCLLAFCSLILAAVLPLLWWHWPVISGYYVVGHVTGTEKHLRAAADGLRTFVDHWSFYPRMVVQHHLGPAATILLASFIATWGITVRRQRRRGLTRPAENRDANPPRDFAAAELLLVMCIGVPVVALSLDTAKSGIVGAIVAPPLVLLGLVRIIRWDRTQIVPTEMYRRLVVAAAVVATIVGLAAPLERSIRSRPMSRARAENESLVSAVDQIVQDHRSQPDRPAGPRVLVDGTHDFMNHGVLNVLAYERFGLLLGAMSGGSRLESIEYDEALRLTANADYAVFGDGTVERVGAFPFDADMARHGPRIVRELEAQLRVVAEFTHADRHYTVFGRARPEDAPPR